MHHRGGGSSSWGHHVVNTGRQQLGAPQREAPSETSQVRHRHPVLVGGRHHSGGISGEHHLGPPQGGTSWGHHNGANLKR